MSDDFAPDPKVMEALETARETARRFGVLCSVASSPQSGSGRTYLYPEENEELAFDLIRRILADPHNLSDDLIAELREFVGDSE